MKKILLIIYIILTLPNINGQDNKWVLGAGGSYNDKVPDLTTDRDGNLYLTGHLYGTIPIGDSSFESNGAYIIKTTNEGEFIWGRSFGNSTTGLDITIDSAFNVYSTGFFSRPFQIEEDSLIGAAQASLYILKLNKDGDYLWIKEFGPPGDRGWVYVNGIETDNEGNLYLAGSFKGSILVGDSVYTPRGRGTYDMFFIKVSPSGEIILIKNPGSSANEYIYDLASASDGVYAVGFFGGSIIDFGDLEYTSSKNSLGCLIKYKFNGDVAWIRTIDAPMFSESFSVTVDKLNEPIVSSMWYHDNSNSGLKISICKFDKLGNQLFNKIINHYEWFGSYVSGNFNKRRWDVTSSERNIYFTAGLSDSLDTFPLTYKPLGVQDVSVIKFNEIGYPQWVYSAQGLGKDAGLRITSSNESIYLSGLYESDTLYFGTNKIINSSKNGYNDFFFARIDDSTSNSCPELEEYSLLYDSSFCEGDSIKLVIENEYAAYIKWFHDTKELNLENFKHIYIKEKGQYTAQINQNTSCPMPELRIQVDLESEQNESSDVIILPTPDIKIVGDETICQGDTINLATNYIQNYVYSWDIPKTYWLSDSTLNSINAVWSLPNDSLISYLHVVDSSNGCLAIDSNIINVKPVPKFSFFISDNTLLIHSNESQSYKWFHNGLELIENEDNLLFNANMLGNYFVIAENEHGCELKSNTIILDELLTLNYSEVQLEVYPNPVKDILFINTSKKPNKIELYDISGNLVSLLTTSEINTTNYNPGIYILKVFLDKKVLSAKVLIE